MAQKNDQIFQLSLTEIAFCIVFVLLLLLGYMVIQEQQAREKAEAALTRVQSLDETLVQLETVRTAFEGELGKAGVVAPDDVITKLLESQSMREERDRLRKQVEDLDAQLTALSELQKYLEKDEVGGAEIVKDEIESALTLQAVVRKALSEQGQLSTDLSVSPSKNESTSTRDSVTLAIETATMLREEVKTKLGKELTPKSEGSAVVDIVDAAKSFGELSKAGMNVGGLRKENADLRGQVAFFKKRLDARGGRDYPPCWADENGAPEYLLDIELRAESVSVTKGWSEKRDVDARALPGISALIEESLSYSRFPSAVQGVFAWSKSQDPECRHYVRLKNSISDAVQSDRSRLMVENFFYKFEKRR